MAFIKLALFALVLFLTTRRCGRPRFSRPVDSANVAA
jgi:hypothetical protein